MLKYHCVQGRNIALRSSDTGRKCVWQHKQTWRSYSTFMYELVVILYELLVYWIYRKCAILFLVIWIYYKIYRGMCVSLYMLTLKATQAKICQRQILQWQSMKQQKSQSLNIIRGWFTAVIRSASLPKLYFLIQISIPHLHKSFNDLVGIFCYTLNLQDIFIIINIFIIL